MNLNDAKLCTDCVIKSMDITDEKIKIRLMELGLNVGTKISVSKKSILKKTLLVVFNFSCFTLKDNIAKQIQVNYA